jgi:hypothetical protein
VTLRHAGRSLLVDLAETAPAETAAPANGSGHAAHATAEAAPEAQPEVQADVADAAAPADLRDQAIVEAVEPAQGHQAIARAQEIFQRASQPPRWPMYVRQVKQYLRAADEGFDERKYGYSTIVEFLRASQREGLFRLERDRQGVLRVFAGPALQRVSAQPAAAAETEPPAPAASPAGDGEGYAPMADALAEAAEPALGLETEPLIGLEPESDGIRTAGDTVPEAVPEQHTALELSPDEGGEPAEPAPPPPARRTRRTTGTRTTTTRKSAGPKTAAPRAPRARKSRT